MKKTKGVFMINKAKVMQKEQSENETNKKELIVMASGMSVFLLTLVISFLRNSI